MTDRFITDYYAAVGETSCPYDVVVAAEGKDINAEANPQGEHQTAEPRTC